MSSWLLSCLSSPGWNQQRTLIFRFFIDGMPSNRLRRIPGPVSPHSGDHSGTSCCARWIVSPVHGITGHVSWPRFQSIRSWQWSRLFSRGSFLTSERCSNISLNLVCPRACWRYCLVLLRHELLRKVDCVSSSRDHRPCFVASFPKHTILATLACSMLVKCACCPAAVLFSLQRGAAIFL